MLFFGGAFDPPHRGHLLCALAASEELKAAEVHWVPSGRPPHRDLCAGPENRAAMTQLCMGQRPGWHLNRCELQQTETSYTLESLQKLRDLKGPERPLCLLIGADQLGKLHLWHRPQAIADLAHLAVMPRPGCGTILENPKSLPAPWGHRVVKSSAKLRSSPSGFLFVLRTTPQIDLSASDIRTCLAAGRTPRDLAPEVLDHIRKHRLYGWKESGSD